MIEVCVPPSKSITQRALILAALSGETSRLHKPLDCDDSRAMAEGLRALGVKIDIDADTWTVVAPAVFEAPERALELGNAGTAVRFLTGLAPLVAGTLVIDGNPAMRRRPMPGLLAALRALGSSVEELGTSGCPPVRITSPGPHGALSGQVHLTAGGSSQELSALLMMGSRWPGGLEVCVDGELPSQPYVELTLGVMREHGIAVVCEGGSVFRVPAQRPRAESFVVEGDWSSASYPLAAGWMTGRAVHLRGVRDDSAQGDRAIVPILEALRATGPRTLSMSDCPDLVPTVAACAMFADGATEIRGVAHLRIKESNRIAGLAVGIRQLGGRAEELADGLRLAPGPLHGGVELDAQDDHRLAMAFGLMSLRVPNLRIRQPECVSKSYPQFWEMLERFR